MPNIDLLLDNIAQMIKSDNKEQTGFSSLDLRYVYSQIPLDQKTREQCNFSLRREMPRELISSKLGSAVWQTCRHFYRKQSIWH